MTPIIVTTLIVAVTVTLPTALVLMAWWTEQPNGAEVAPGKEGLSGRRICPGLRGFRPVCLKVLVRN